MEEKSKKDSDEFQLDWDTDTFESGGFEGVERDKRGELAILLPDSSRTIARLRGFDSRSAEDRDEGGPHEAAAFEKGSRFSGILRDEEGIIPIGQAETKGLVTQVSSADETPLPAAGPVKTKEPADQQSDELSVKDFDLDFGLPSKKAVKQKPEETPAPVSKQPKPGKTKVRPAWMPPEEKEPLAPPAAQTGKVEAKKEIPFEEPELPDTGPPVIIKGPRSKAPAGAETRPRPALPDMEARSYLEGESVVKRPAAEMRRPRTKKKMKLPKRVREKKGKPLLAVLMILLLLTLAGVLLVQHVPEARKYYDDAVARIFGEKQTPGSMDTRQPEEDGIVFRVGGEAVKLKEGTNVKAVESYTDRLREMFSESGRACQEER